MTKARKLALDAQSDPHFLRGVGDGPGFVSRKYRARSALQKSVLVVPRKFISRGSINTLDHYVVIGIQELFTKGDWAGDSAMMDVRWVALDPDVAVVFATKILEQASDARYARERNPRFGGEG